MAEVSFARTFVSTLDTRPMKISGDHVEDPRKFPARPPYILPRMSTPMSKPSASVSAPGQERSVTVTLKSLRNPPLDIKLSAQPLSTSVHDIKAEVSSQTRIPVDKMKLLLSKRPVQDSKILRDLVGPEGAAAATLDFSVMVMGGAAAIPPAEEPAAAETPAEVTGADALATDQFWSDLGGFLSQRLKDQGQAEQLSALFRSSWESGQAKS